MRHETVNANGYYDCDVFKRGLKCELHVIVKSYNDVLGSWD